MVTPVKLQQLIPLLLERVSDASTLYRLLVVNKQCYKITAQMLKNNKNSVVYSELDQDLKFIYGKHFQDAWARKEAPGSPQPARSSPQSPKKYDYQIKMSIVGDSGAGASTFFSSALQMPELQRKIELGIKFFNYNERIYRVMLSDKKSVSDSLANSNVLFVMYDTDYDHGIEKWTRFIKSSGSKAIVVFVANSFGKNPFSLESAREKVKKWHNLIVNSSNHESPCPYILQFNKSDPESAKRIWQLATYLGMKQLNNPSQTRSSSPLVCLSPKISSTNSPGGSPRSILKTSNGSLNTSPGSPAKSNLPPAISTSMHLSPHQGRRVNFAASV